MDDAIEFVASQVTELEAALTRERALRIETEKLLRLQYRIANAMRSVRDPAKLLGEILDALVTVDGVDAGGVYLFEPDGSLRLRVHRGLSAAFIAAVTSFPPDAPNVALARAGVPVYQPYSVLAPQFREDSTQLAEGLRAMAVLPVLHNGDVTAVLNLASHETDVILPEVRTTFESCASLIGEVVAWMGSETARRDRERDLSLLFHSIDDFLFVLDESGNIVRCNRAVEERLGFAEAELIGVPVLNVHPPDRRDEAAAIVGAMLEERRRTCPIPLQAKDGSRIPVETRVIKGTWNGRPALFGVSRDIADRERAEAELRAQRDFARLVMDNMTQGLTVTGSDGSFSFVNAAYAEFLGVPPESLVGRWPAEVTAPVDHSVLAQARVDRVAGLTTEYETRLVRADGELVPVMVKATPIMRDGQFTGGVAVITDLTRHRQAEETRLALERRVMEAEKAASLGTMAGGVAHHFNNQLTAVIGNLDFVLDSPDLSDLVRVDILNARAAATRAAQLSTSMLTYLGHNVRRDVAIQAEDAIRSAIAVVERMVPPSVRLAIDVRTGGLRIAMASDQFERILVNLTINAAEALPTWTGHVTVTLDAVPRATLDQETVSRIAAGVETLVSIDVRDTGRGMSADTLVKAFDPFFTTHMVGRGLGLPITQGLVHGAGGVVLVSSSVGEGTCVRVLLPSARPSVERPTRE